MDIRLDDLQGPEIAQLLQEHLNSMQLLSPAESVHALDLTKLRQPDITFWCAWREAELLGCGALKELTPDHGEIKSMRTATAHLRRGVAARILARLGKIPQATQEFPFDRGTQWGVCIVHGA